MVYDPVSVEDVALSVTLPSPLEQAQTDMQGCYLVVTVNNCCSEGQYAYDTTFGKTSPSPVVQTVTFSSSVADNQLSFKTLPLAGTREELT